MYTYNAIVSYSDSVFEIYYLIWLTNYCGKKDIDYYQACHLFSKLEIVNESVLFATHSEENKRETLH